VEGLFVLEYMYWCDSKFNRLAKSFCKELFSNKVYILLAFSISDFWLSKFSSDTISYLCTCYFDVRTW
jgi:hypothetical protein